MRYSARIRILDNAVEGRVCRQLNELGACLMCGYPVPSQFRPVSPIESETERIKDSQPAVRQICEDPPLPDELTIDGFAKDANEHMRVALHSGRQHRLAGIREDDIDSPGDRLARTLAQRCSRRRHNSANPAVIPAAEKTAQPLPAGPNRRLNHGWRCQLLHHDLTSAAAITCW